MQCVCFRQDILRIDVFLDDELLAVFLRLPFDMITANGCSRDQQLDAR